MANSDFRIFSVRLPVDLIERLEQAANDDDRTRNYVIRRALEDAYPAEGGEG